MALNAWENQRTLIEARRWAAYMEITYGVGSTIWTDGTCFWVRRPEDPKPEARGEVEPYVIDSIVPWRRG